jgi:ABC-2 type transport system permease protein
MKAIFRYTLSGFRWAMVGWGLGLGLLGGYLIPFYDTIFEQRAQWEELLRAYPRELLVFFGEIQDIADPATYLHAEFFSWLPLILGFFAILAGSALIAGLEEGGQLDLLLGQPVSRWAFFAARVLAFLVATVGILGLSYLGLILARPLSRHLGLGPWEMLTPFLSMFALLWLFGSLSLWLSLALPSRRVAAAVAGTLLVAGFFLTALARLDERLEPVARLSPFTYYQGGEAVRSLRVDWLVGLLIASLVFLLLAGWWFQRKDLRVSGEGTWALSLPRSRAVWTAWDRRTHASL